MMLNLAFISLIIHIGAGMYGIVQLFVLGLKAGFPVFLKFWGISGIAVIVLSLLAKLVENIKTEDISFDDIRNDSLPQSPEPGMYPSDNVPDGCPPFLERFKGDTIEKRYYQWRWLLGHYKRDDKLHFFM